MKKRSTHIDRVALALRDRRRDMGISRRELAECAGVSPATIVRLEEGTRVRPSSVTRVAVAMAAFELYASAPKAEAEATPEDELVALVRVAS